MTAKQATRFDSLGTLMADLARTHAPRKTSRSSFLNVMNFKPALLLGLTLGVFAPMVSLAQSQTTPDFGPNVYIADPSMSSATIQAKLVSLSQEAQFSANRH